MTDFVFINKTKGLRQSWCRPCDAAYKRDWYAKNGERHRAKVKISNLKTKTENRDRIWEYLKTHPCVDCGETDPVVLEFDHLRDKVENVSTMLLRKWAWPAIEAEIGKCEVRCANCHRRKTARERSWYQNRYEPTIEEAPARYAW